jgi:hypothetical protein
MSDYIENWTRDLHRLRQAEQTTERYLGTFRVTSMIVRKGPRYPTIEEIKADRERRAAAMSARRSA